MKRVEELKEFALIEHIAGVFKRSPLQANARHGADSELVRLGDGRHLAFTIDGLYEEAKLGLLVDPAALGWAIVAHSLSDLAAVAARPLGVLLSYNLPKGADPGWVRAINMGAAAALEAHGTFCLGGDTSFADDPSFQCAAAGIVEGEPLVTRVGARAGDALYLTGPAGAGNLLGIAKRIGEPVWARMQARYRPRARFREIELARPYVRAAIDSSDGLLAAIDMLARVNGLGAHFAATPDCFDPALRELSAQAGFPCWIGAAFGVGEYELVLAIDRERVPAFEAAAAAAGVPFLAAGRFLAEPRFRMDLDGRTVELDTTYLMNLFPETGTLDRYVEALLAYDRRLRTP